MSVDFAGLQQLVTDRAVNKALVSPAFEQLKPTFDRVNGGYFQLGQIKDLDCWAAAKAISLVIGLPVVSVIPVSLSNPFPKPDFMAREVYQRAIGDSFSESIINSLLDSLGNNNLREGLWSSLWKTLGGSHGDTLECRFKERLTNILYYYLGSIIMADTESVDRFTPFIQLHGRGFVELGFKRGERDVALVLAA